ncbi:hypothetical protein GGX14DRAFT_392746 [Mycena pura]|uniref:Uncharacterized protein n=1 Tax=Mycena pura TaxID=153505 RepID=A0AAD6VIH2_9AGAR|nr:hypothetical protein GGX14DRAFT_392746 [Mycena pura]
MYDTQLLSSLLIASISLIPNQTIRLAALAVSLVTAFIHAIYLKYPSTQLAQLEAIIDKTEQVIQDAEAHCLTSPFILVEANLRLLEVKFSASYIRCHILESRTFMWKNYYQLSRDISTCAQVISKALITVQVTPLASLIVEADQQHKYAVDIRATQTALDHYRTHQLGYCA